MILAIILYFSIGTLLGGISVYYACHKNSHDLIPVLLCLFIAFWPFCVFIIAGMLLGEYAQRQTKALADEEVRDGRE